ncbi:SapC protein [Desulfobotulus alkaliphilus]|uniref:SapC protein n=1 Tax=Desulfobotulus alkaliphilus TaxID=622671 RepID=A0A562RHK9_9BACT|nr:SapC family protein [Desulfobotulus alkaliphilus]TWI68498.1 SapC protein [Desulfobotulus alkaliphilus]
MQRFIALQRSLHQGAGWKRAETFTFAAEDAVAPVLAIELPHLLPTMPLGFIFQEEPSIYQMVALQSLTPGLNLFIHPDGRWLGGYIPAVYRGYPFRLLPVEGSNRQALCVDTQSGLFHENSEADDVSFFTPEGEMTQDLKNVFSFLKQCEEDRFKTQEAVNLISSMGLIAPWKIRVQNEGVKEEAAQFVKGLFKIDEQALKGLEPEKVGVLSKTGALSLVYAQLFSQHRLAGLTKLYQLRKEIVASTKVPEINLDEIFGGSDDTLKF